MDNILHGLNGAQRSAVASPAEVLQVLAPPGSGKTKTLTARVAYLVAHRQLLPWNIIVCTFTVKAASEMKDRITTFVGKETSRQLKLGTFHSVALRYLKQYGQHINLPKDFGIADSSDSKAILKRLIKQLGMSMPEGQALGRISSQKVKGSDPRHEKTAMSVERRDFQRLFNEYEQTLANSNLLDYDDILLRCVDLLKRHPECVSNVEAVLIDEFQDTNYIQYDLMRLFAQQKNVITIVGDPDQSIYGFRSAEIANLARMKNHWPDTLTINLEENYRSSGAILHAAQNIIEQDEGRPPKKLQATHSFGLRPILRRLPSAPAEAEWLVSEIKRIRALTGDMIQSGDFAILLRSAALSRAIETALVNGGMPYRMVGGTRFYDRAEVKLVVDYLRVIHQPNNNEAVERIVNVPSRRVGEETIKKLRSEAQSRGCSIWQLILNIAQGRLAPRTQLSEPAQKGLSSFVNVVLSGRRKMGSNSEASPMDLINLVVQKISLQSYLKSKHTEDQDYEARWANVEELMAQAADVMAPGKLEELRENESLPTIEGVEQREVGVEDSLSIFLNNIALTASAEKRAEEDGETVQQVTISTVHAAKGLEWPVVFIPACYDGSIPHSRADDHDEERRLLYVGMTRAQAILYLSCPIKNSKREETLLSTFLTHPGASHHFEEHGPSVPATITNGLAVTLGRACPEASVIAAAKETLERDEDNYWPLNGEEALEETGRWDYAKSASLPGFGKARAAAWTYSNSTTMTEQGNFSTSSATMPMGFTSVAARYDEIMEAAQLRKVDKRAEQNQRGVEVPKGRKRPVEGHGSIASFFAKKQRPAAETETDVREAPSRPTQPLEDISNTADLRHARSLVVSKTTLPTHKPRTAPRPKRPSLEKSTAPDQDKYVFLSSSPTRPEPDENHADPAQNEVRHDSAILRPATTFHTTSMAKVAPQRKTLGMRRSLQGWNAARKPQ